MASNIVFRVVGIPISASVEELNDVLTKYFSAENITVNTQKTSICPSCYQDGSATALVQFDPEPPKNLKTLKQGEGYDLVYGDGEETINIDKDFYGLTPLYSPQGNIDAE